MRFLTLALLLVACQPMTPAPVDPHNPPPPKPGGSDCSSICTHYANMECVEAEPTAEGHTCVEVCVNMRDSELPDLDSYFECVAASQTCQQSRDC